MIASAQICPGCRSHHGTHAQFCSHCGLFLGASQTAVVAAPSGVYCPACGRQARAGAKVCGACGTPLVWKYRPLQPGQVLANGRYTIRRALSKGGMGAIYVAHDHQAFDRDVVIKALLDYFDPYDVEAAQTARARFLHEARTLAALRHPAIPHIFAYFAEGPYNYIVMEYVEGRDLDQGLTRKDDTTGRLLRGSPYADDDVIRWGVTLCRVLHYLASRQPQPVIHQDIKPANILLDTNSDDIRLVDFGTARARLVAQPAGTVGVQKSSVFGTQGYAAPEQYGGQSEPRSDVYALASTMYHLLTDDDPRDHPFDFPRLKALGRLGTALRSALQEDARNRPPAATFRHQLEVLLHPRHVHTIETPDGTPVSNEQELTRWCEQHWREAGQWLYDHHKLSDQIERFWGKNKLASDIRRQAQAHVQEHDRGVDAMLALLDPHGYGQAMPQVAVAPPQIDFGRLAADDHVEHRCTITNTGRRYVVAQIETPSWITTSQHTFGLAPQESVAFTLLAMVQPNGMSGKLRDHLTVRATDTASMQVGVEAEISRWRSFWRRMTHAGASAPVVAPPEVQYAIKASTTPTSPTTPNVARVAAATQQDAQRKLKPPPMIRIGTVVVRNRAASAAWFTKAERNKVLRLAQEAGADAVIEPLGVQCWHEFRVVCRNRATAAAVMDGLAKLNETKKGVTQLELEIVGG